MKSARACGICPSHPDPLSHAHRQYILDANNNTCFCVTINKHSHEKAATAIRRSKDAK